MFAASPQVSFSRPGTLTLISWSTPPPGRDDRGVKCHTYLRTLAQLNSANRENKKLNDGDRQSAKRAEKPLYLVVPNRDCVKVYRQQSDRNWSVERIAGTLQQCN